MLFFQNISQSNGVASTAQVSAMRARIRFSLKTLLLIPTVVSVVLAGLWWWPKSQPLSINEDVYKGYYRGLGLSDDRGFFGKQFFDL